MNPAVPAVFDCNLYFQALINEEGPAGKCLTAAFQGDIVLFLSRRVLREVRRTASDSILRAKFRQRFRSLHIVEPQTLLRALERLKGA